jgi:hypothetical protein
VSLFISGMNKCHWFFIVFFTSWCV